MEDFQITEEGSRPWYSISSANSVQEKNSLPQGVTEYLLAVAHHPHNWPRPTLDAGHFVSKFAVREASYHEKNPDASFHSIQVQHQSNAVLLVMTDRQTGKQFGLLLDLAFFCTGSKVALAVS